MEKEIPCVLMRGGTSRGPFFRADVLPPDRAERDRLLIAAMGSPHELQINGLGGGNSLSSKVAIVSPSSRPGCDVDYLFAQVLVDRELVDTRPNCGNMLAAVGPFALEQGLVRAHCGETAVRIFNVNTGSTIEALVQTPGGRVTYDGETRIDGVPGTAAPVILNFLGAEGSLTGRLFPTGAPMDIIDGVEATCLDAAIPLMIVDARSLGLSGGESPQELDGNAPLLRRIEALRIEAGRRMGLGDVTDSVVPKPVLVSPAGDGLSIRSRYFTPHRCHRAHAVTGAIGVAGSLVLPGTVSSALRGAAPFSRGVVSVFHPAGRIEISIELCSRDGVQGIAKAGVVRTARKIMQGTVCIPSPLSDK
ncbi:4-oxalomesaconate tautomerase [Candidimonas humi]|uniref:4-oxalomesaconate tautomerase n=1 Tax=Candidimonas humi TaxID=683355 RepID=A0ABV8P0K1_9BURK|nr:4-oxalomesaconate tautomerase [Candidimonas humi]MBV6306868.1 4-oxalomesaconate tautomerase [Candidimonas humi]